MVICLVMFLKVQASMKFEKYKLCCFLCYVCVAIFFAAIALWLVTVRVVDNSGSVAICATI